MYDMHAVCIGLPQTYLILHVCFVWVLYRNQNHTLQIAHWAIAAGFKPKDTVALFMENRPEYIMTWLGLAKAGCVIALINSNNKKKPLIHSISIANCSGLIFGSELTANVEGVLTELQETGIGLYSFADKGQTSPSFATDLANEVRFQKE